MPRGAWWAIRLWRNEDLGSLFKIRNALHLWVEQKEMWEHNQGMKTSVKRKLDLPPDKHGTSRRCTQSIKKPHNLYGL